MNKKTKLINNKTSFIEIALILIGLMIIAISLITWIPREESELMFKINFLSFAIGILYILFAVLLRKIKH